MGDVGGEEESPVGLEYQAEADDAREDEDMGADPATSTEIRVDGDAFMGEYHGVLSELNELISTSRQIREWLPVFEHSEHQHESPTGAQQQAVADADPFDWLVEKELNAALCVWLLHIDVAEATAGNNETEAVKADGHLADSTGDIPPNVAQRSTPEIQVVSHSIPSLGMHPLTFRGQVNDQRELEEAEQPAPSSTGDHGNVPRGIPSGRLPPPDAASPDGDISASTQPQSAPETHAPVDAGAAAAATAALNQSTTSASGHAGGPQGGIDSATPRGQAESNSISRGRRVDSEEAQPEAVDPRVERVESLDGLTDPAVPDGAEQGQVPLHFVGSGEPDTPQESESLLTESEIIAEQELVEGHSSTPPVQADTFKSQEPLDSQVEAARSAVEAAEEESRQAWAEALEAEKQMIAQVEAGLSREIVRASEDRAAALRSKAMELSKFAEDARLAAHQVEDRSDAARSAETYAQALKRALELEEQERKEANEREMSEESERKRLEKERLLREENLKAAAKQEILRREALQRRDARRRRDAAAAAQSKAVEDRAELARKTLKLDLSSLGVCDIPDYVYSDPLLKHIRILWLNQNEFETLPPEISKLQDLTQLRVFQNKLRFLPPEIGDLEKLQILWLQDNLLDTLPPEIEKLTSLTLLSLKGNPLKVLPVELSRLKRIREMELDTDALTFPPPAISRAGTRQVQDFLRRADRAWGNNKLDLSSMDLDCLPLDIIQLFPRIDKLWIAGNPISNIPFEFSAMTQLTDLRFDRETMVSPSMEIWDFGLPRALEFMGKFLSYRTVPQVDLRGWQLGTMPNEIFDNELCTRITVIDFTRNKLQELPSHIDSLQSLTKLLVDDNMLQTLPKTVCLLSALTYLSATGNQLTSFPNCMGSMASLTDLMLDRNQLVAIPSTILRVRKLKNLSLASNRISDLPPELPKLTTLRTLNVEDNLIERLPLEFGVFTSLTRLQVAGNPMWSPPKDILRQGRHVWFGYLDRLLQSLQSKSMSLDGRIIKGSTLDLCRFDLTEFPPEITRFPSQFMCITQVTMDSNNLSNLPREMGKLTNITVLSLAKNAFRACPSVLGKLYNLTDVNFERNLLTYLPIEIGNLTALKKLRVEGNRFTHPPMEIIKLGVTSILRFLKVFSQGSGSGEVTMSGCNLKAFPLAVTDIENLTQLDLSHNSIGRIPFEFLSNQTVRYLDLSYNDLSELEPGIAGLIGLQTLILSGNRITMLAPALFALTRLEVLVMNQNQVHFVPPQIGTMTWLRELKISNNDLDTLPLEIGRMISLQRLNLAYNSITAVPATIGNLTSLRDFSLIGNKLTCLPPIMGVMTGLSQLGILDNDLDRHPVEVVDSAKQLQATSKVWHDGQAPASPLCLWLARMRAARITKALDASRFDLVQVPTEVLLLTALQLLHLGLEHNRVKILPPSIAGLSTLTSLNLSHNKLKSVPPVIGIMSNLTVLYLNNNKIVRLPIEIGHLPETNLTRLSISHNRLETPPKELMTQSTANILRYYATAEVAILTGELDWSWCKNLLSMRSICLEVLHWERLIILHLDNNEISSIDSEMCLTMDRLEVLELRRNRLTGVPDQLCAHTRLRVLALSSNKITKLPVALHAMRCLTDLEIAGMSLVFPCKEITRYGTENILAYLAAIYLSYSNQVCVLNNFDLSEIPPEVLDMRYAVILELDHMRISTLPAALTSLTALNRFSFCYNFVSDLPSFMSCLSNLTELEFEGNKVKCLLPEHHSLTKLNHLNLRKNPIKTPPLEVLQTMEAHLSSAARPSSPQRNLMVAGQKVVDGIVRSDNSALRAGFELNPVRVLAFLRALFHARSGDLLDLCDFGLSLWPFEIQDTPHLLRLHVDKNSIRLISPDVQNLDCLQELSVEHNCLKSLVAEIGMVTTLKTLRLSYNQIEELPNSISSLANLEILCATDNLIALLPAALFQCTNLKALVIDRNRITEIPPEFGGLQSLENLAYSGNPIIIPPEEIRFQGLAGLLRFYQQIMCCAPACSLRGMECEAAGFDLDLSNFSLFNIPEVVHRGMPRPGGSWDDPPNRFRRDRWAFGMTHLTRLRLDHNKISELPALISRCFVLKYISLTHNLLKGLPASFTALRSLQELDLRNNLLENLPDVMSRLEDLRVLLLDENQLTQLPNGLGKIPELHTLEVNKNCLASLPVDLCETHSLRVLGVKDNPLKMPPNEIVERGLRHIMDWLGRLLRCRQTNTLDLRGLSISSIDYEVLPIEGVRRILLANNKLTTISSTPTSSVGGVGKTEVQDESNAQKLQNLEYLNADDNLLAHIPDSIALLTSLVEISIKNNRIEEIPPALARLTNLKKLYLSNNRLTSLPLELAALRSVLRKLDLEGNELSMPPKQICAAGTPIMIKYLEDLARSKHNLSLEMMGFKLCQIPEEVLLITQLQRLILDDNEIAELPLAICKLENLTQLSLTRNQLDNIPRELCERMTRLRCLHLNANNIALLPLQIGKLTELQELYLQDNAVSILPLEVGDLRQLHTLVLDVADMVSPTPEICVRGTRAVIYYLQSIGAARSTKTADLRSMGLTAFPVEVFAVSGLTALHLDDNHLSSLPSSIERLTALTELTLTRLPIAALPHALGACSSLTSLRIDASRRFRNPPYEVVMQGTAVVIDYLRKTHACARESGYVNVSEMRLEGLPTELLHLKNLRHLQARNNSIQHLPVAIEEMHSIEVLHLHCNSIVALPREIGRLVTLAVLRLPSNRLRVLPAELGDCYGLRHLSLQNNLLATLPSLVLSGLSGLFSLNASRNQIIVVPDALGDMHSLEKLRLDQNQLRSLPAAICGCTNLSLLSLTCNLLAALPDSLAQCTRLTALHLSSNRFRQLPRCVETLFELRWLWAANNELIGLPTCLAGLPNLYELQVNGCSDLRYPPPDIVAEGLEAVRAYLLCNMQYEDPPRGPSRAEEEASVAEARARDDVAAADLAGAVIKPLRRQAEEAAAAAEEAEAKASELRRLADTRQLQDPVGAVLRDLSLDERGRAAALELAMSVRDEEEDTARVAEIAAARLRAEATATAAWAAEAVVIFNALSAIAAESEAEAETLRVKAGGYKVQAGKSVD